LSIEYEPELTTSGFLSVNGCQYKEEYKDKSARVGKSRERQKHSRVLQRNETNRIYGYIQTAKKRLLYGNCT
jgi:hypothetical protein